MILKEEEKILLDIMLEIVKYKSENVHLETYGLNQVEAIALLLIESAMWHSWMNFLSLIPDDDS